MNAIVMKKDGSVYYTEVPNPLLQSGQVLLRVAACGICGTDMHVHKGMANSWSLPGIIGHELAGTVVECAPDVTVVETGEAVTIQPLVSCGICDACISGRTNLCRKIRLIGGEIPGGFAEYIAVPAESVIPLPAGMPVEQGALAEPAATAVHAVNRLGGRRYKRAVVFGAGAIGLLILSVLRDAVEFIAVADIDEKRLERAQRLGADAVLHSAREDVSARALELSCGKPYGLAVDAAGLSATRLQGLSLLASGGDFLFVALGDVKTEVDFLQLVTGELRLFGTQCHTKDDFALALDMIADGRIDYEQIVTQLPLSRGVEAFENPRMGVKLHLLP
jgi:2-desacetyl-2-hydroxyethyl bacteriochlorophyllide A dehydrogenase